MDKEKLNKDDNQSFARWTGLGFEFAAVLAIFSYLGFKLDQKLNSSPWFLLGGFALGFATMMYIIIKEVFKIGRR